MKLKQGPESHSGPSGARWEFVRLSSTILGLLYLFAGLCASGVTGIRYYYRGMPPDERMYWFHYGNGTPLFPDQGTMVVFSSLSFATVFLLMAAGCVQQQGKGIPAEQVVGELWAAHRR